MADNKRIVPLRTPFQPPHEERAEKTVGRDPRTGRQALPDPETGEVPAGPGDSGLSNRPEKNAGSPGTKQMSNRRLGIGLGIAALLAVLGAIFAAMF